MKEAINVGVMKATVIMRETEMTEGIEVVVRDVDDKGVVTEGEVERDDVEIDVDEGLNKMITLVFTCASLICLCMRFFDKNFSPHVLHSSTLFIKDSLLLLLY